VLARIPLRAHLGLETLAWSRGPWRCVHPVDADATSSTDRNGSMQRMLTWAIVFLVIAIIAGFFGFTGVSAAAAGIAKILFFIFVTIFVLMLVLSFMSGVAAG